MKKLLKFLVKEITGAKSINITEESRDGISVYTITVPQEFVGQLIGKEGRIISSLRTLAAIRAARENIKIGIDIKEEET